MSTLAASPYPSEPRSAAPHAAPTPAADDRRAGLILLVGALASIAFMVFDVNGGGKDALGVMQGMVRTAGPHAAVHVGQMACLAGLLFGHVHLAQRLGLQRPLVKAGLLGYGLGAVLMLICTAIDGFILPDVAAAFVSGAAEAQQTGWALIKAGYVVLTELARIAWVFEALGAMVLSVALLARRGLARRIGAIGIVAGALPAAAVIAAGSQLDPMVLVAVLVLQALWYLCAAWLLWQGVPAAPAAHP